MVEVYVSYESVFLRPNPSSCAEVAVAEVKIRTRLEFLAFWLPLGIRQLLISSSQEGEMVTHLKTGL